MGTSGIIPEKYLKDSPKPVTIEGTRTILKQMENFVCKISGYNGTGFFCKIKDPYTNNFKNVLFTNNHILCESDIEDNKTIYITMNNDSQSKKIKIDKNRIRYTNENLDVTIIEIIKSDEISNFLELDEDIYKDIGLLENIYEREKQSLYVLQYPRKEVVRVSYGMSVKIKNNFIYHTCNTDGGSSGSPILSLKSFKVLGIHFGATYYEYNKGTFIKAAIDEFFKYIYSPFFYVKTNNLKKLKEIYDKNNDILTLKDKNQQTLLHCSVICKNYEITKFLLEKGIKYDEPDNPFLLVIQNNLEKLKEIYNKNNDILTLKDKNQQTLLHCSVICENYEIAKFLLEKGIKYDEPDDNGDTALFLSSKKLKKLLESYGAKEEHFCSNYIEKPNFKDKKLKLIYEDLNKNGLVDGEMIEIKKDNKIIGKRINRKIKVFRYYENVYHGTRFEKINGIMSKGLINTGKPLRGHITLGKKCDDINNWANAIFVTPSIFYASKNAEIIYSDGEEWYIIIEAALAYLPPSKFISKFREISIHESKFYNYNFKEGEPKEIEVRIEAIPDEIFTNTILTTSLLFVNKKYLDEVKNYSEGNIFKKN